MVTTTVHLDKRGAVVIPKNVRRALGIEPDGLLLLRVEDGRIVLIPAEAVPKGERYSPQRVAEFLLTNAIDENDYARARDRVRGLGLDPDTIAHERPGTPDPRIP
ncbi:MAG TPA: AbrB family transcriptional regulator [Phycisphaerales bacterium]|nr:AbrB family transcriptional regulator [Phycisphaerales bacterium]